MRKILEQCPSCKGDLEVTRLSCTSCETTILGRYQPCPFCQLSPENTRLLETFVKCRGNVKEMERELGLSYWTVRRMLNELIEALGYEAEAIEEEEAKERQLEILRQIDQGEIDAAQAAEMLEQLKEGPQT